MTRALKIAGALVVAIAIGLWLLAGRDLAYLIRVVSHGDSDTDDYRWKASLPIPATNPRPWTAVDDCSTSTAEAFGQGSTSTAEALGQGSTSTAEALGQGSTSTAELDRWLADGGALAFVVVHHGVVRCNWSAEGRTDAEPAAVFSITKTVTSLLLARAVQAGTIHSLDDPITRYVPELLTRDARFGHVTLSDLVDMRSGIGFSGQTTFPWVNQDAPAVYYASDLARTVAERPAIVDSPGPFLYNDYAPNLIGLALERTGSGSAAAGPMTGLWQELGAEHDALWSTDEQGFPWYESGLVATASDIARIGQLLLDGGQVDGRQVAPPAFVDRSLAAGDTGTVAVFAGTSVGYGNGWWTLEAEDGTTDLVAMGDHGQVMVVSPSADTVVVHLGQGGPETNIAIARRLQAMAHQIGR